MKKYVANFLKSRNLLISDEPPVMKCEWCFKRLGTSIHHIRLKGMGGSKLLDHKENLIGLCGLCHRKAHGLEGETLDPALLERRVELILEETRGTK